MPELQSQYDNFDIRIHKAEKGYAITAESEVGETVNEIVQTLPYKDDFMDAEYYLRELMATEEDALIFGKQIYDFLFPPNIKSFFDTSLGYAKGRRNKLRIRLHLTADIPVLSRIAWEYCRNTKDFFYALDPETPLVRYLHVDEPPIPLEMPHHIRILFVTANPKETRELDIKREENHILDALQTLLANGRIQIKIIHHVTRTKLSTAVQNFIPHIIHFSGHGSITDNGQSLLWLEDDHGEQDPIDAHSLRILLKGNNVQLVVLNACQTADHDTTVTFAGMAQGLVYVGLPAAIGMQFFIPDNVSHTFTQVFYQQLVDGIPLDAAVTNARVSIHFVHKKTTFWGIPVLFMRSPDGVLWKTLQVDIQPLESTTNIEVQFPFYDIGIYHQNPNFTGRESVLKELHIQLNKNRTTTITQTISGLGGVGKTQLAIEYIYRHREDYDIISWLAGDNELSLSKGLVELGKTLQVVHPSSTDLETNVQTVRRWLINCQKRWLLIIDNADSLLPATITKILPSLGNGNILITSRNPNWNSIGHVISLDVFTQEEAVDYLRNRLVNVDETEASALTKTLGNFPLALEHAASYVEHTQCSLAAYHVFFREHRQKLFEITPLPTAYHATIATTWELAFKRVEETEGSVDVLKLCAFLDPENIPIELLLQANLVPNPLSLNEAIAALRNYSLLERHSETIANYDFVKLHRMVQFVVRDRMSREEAQTYLNKAIDLVALLWSFDEFNMETWQESNIYFPHLIAVVGSANDTTLRSERIAYLNNQVGFYYTHFGTFKDVKPYYECALSIYEKTLGTEDSTATCLSNLGNLTYLMGEYEAAQSYLKQALSLREKVLEPNDTAIVSNLNDLGIVLQARGDLSNAKLFFEKSLALSQQLSRADPLLLASSMDSLGMLLWEMGDLGAATKYIEKALEIRNEVLKIDHPAIAISLNHQGILLQAIGNHKDAQKCYQDAIKIQRESLGEKHIYLAKSLSNLGNLFRNMKMYDESFLNLKDAQTIYEEVLGDNHSLTAQGFNDLGRLLMSMGDYETAKIYLEQALRIREQVLGMYHSDTATSLNNLAGLLQAMQENDLAKEYYEKAFNLNKQILGTNHPETALSLNNLGYLLQAMEDYEKAKDYYEQALTILEKILGSNHPYTNIVRNNLINII